MTTLPGNDPMILETRRGRRLGQVRRFSWHVEPHIIDMTTDRDQERGRQRLVKAGISKIVSSFNSIEAVDSLWKLFMNDESIVVRRRGVRYEAVVYSISADGDVTLWLVNQLGRVRPTR